MSSAFTRAQIWERKRVKKKREMAKHTRKISLQRAQSLQNHNYNNNNNDKSLTTNQTGKTTTNLSLNTDTASDQDTLKRKLVRHIVAVRPWTFSTSFMPVILGSFLAYKAEGVLDISVFLITIITILLVHAAANLTNSYCDAFHGMDTIDSLDRTLVDRILEPRYLINFLLALYFLSFVGFLLLCSISTASTLDLTLLFLSGVSGSCLYSAGLGLKYTPVGEFLIFLIFGPQITTFAFLSQTGYFSVGPTVLALPLALHTVAITHSRNFRNKEQDKLAGSLTLAIILGDEGCHVSFLFLLFAPYAQFIALGIFYSTWFLYPIVSIFIAVVLERKFQGNDLDSLHRKLNTFHFVTSLLYLASICATEAHYLPL